MRPTVEQRQYGVLRRSQLQAQGYTEGQVRAHLGARRWQTVGPLVVVTHNGPLTLLQQRWAAVLHAGPAAALAGRTALALDGLRGWECGPIHLLVARGRRPVGLPELGLVVHETRIAIGEIGRHDPPRTSVERSAIDAAAWSASARTACGLLAAVVQQRLATPGQLSIALDSAGRIRHCRVMQLALTDINGGADALSEIDMGRLCKKYGLGVVVRQQVRIDGQGRRRYLDGVLIADDGTSVAFEVDGAPHMSVTRWSQDQHRANELLIVGQAVLRFSNITIRTQPDLVADQFRRALAQARRVRTSRGQDDVRS